MSVPTSLAMSVMAALRAGGVPDGCWTNRVRSPMGTTDAARLGRCATAQRQATAGRGVAGREGGYLLRAVLVQEVRRGRQPVDPVVFGR
jgi:hypothetical protein